MSGQTCYTLTITNTHTVLWHSKSINVLICKQVIIHIRVTAIIQHASVSFAGNQYNGLSDKEGDVHGQRGK